MNYFRSVLFLLSIISLHISCSNQSKAVDKSPSNEKAPKQDRNMFGHGIKRGLMVNQDGALPGFLMLNVPNSASTYLINRNGEVVHEWKGNYGVMGSYIVDDGSLVQNVYDPDFPIFAGGGETGRIQKITWQSKIIWDFEYANEEYHAHHDFHVMPNGNILAIAWESKSIEEALAAGCRPDQIPKAGIWPDKIVEIKPTDKIHGVVVWEWHVWDHLIQDFDQNKANYGSPQDHPELLDIHKMRPLPPLITQDSMETLQAHGGQWRNQTADNRGSDIFHFNAVNYNHDLDQIIFSSPVLNEIFIIDHSTTTQEAKTGSGGRQGKGGDFLYRWGNPQNYQRGDSTDQKLFGQHDVRWIEKGKPGAGNLTIFNNDVPMGPDSMEYSSILEFTPPVNNSGNYVLEDSRPFGPQEPVWTYIASDTISFFSSFISGAHRTSNGNTFITEGAKGRSFEVNVSGEIIWEYLNPFRGDIREPNGDPVPVMPMTFSMFRSTFIEADHPALAGKELKPLDPQPEVFIPPPPPPSGE
ncbi:MAG: aryl-sulfate sulfotransferase [Saprospiraceae bacterium]|nr:aryl-sulfate sulfotransferase [Saprospiraceae bacterium]